MNNEKDLVTKVTMAIKYKQNDCLGENMICCILKSDSIFFLTVLMKRIFRYGRIGCNQSVILSFRNENIFITEA